MKKINESNKMTEKDFGLFIESDDILKMSDENVDMFFDGLYGYILNDAVYPHLAPKEKVLC
jgi:hypothetical protein